MAPPPLYLTADLPGTGGVIRQRPEEFLVEEQPLYPLADEGEHLWLFIQKTGLTTPEAIRRVARAFQLSRRDVGYAGLKDKHAVTRQHLSLYLPKEEPGQVEGALERIAADPQLDMLWHTRHANKLRRGHHAGNRFVIYVRDVSPTAVVHAKPILDRLARRGVPDRFGPQRFGYRDNAHILGRLLLVGGHEAFLDEMLGRAGEDESEPLRLAREAYRDGNNEEAMRVWPRSLRYDRQALDALRQGRSPLKAVRAIDRDHRDFLLSAFQSAIFNAVLDRRIEAGTFDWLLPGDLAWKHDNRSVFAVDEATAEAENDASRTGEEGGRVARLEVSPSGPMWGGDMTLPGGEVLEMEEAALRETGVTRESLGDPPGAAGVPIKLAGARRPLRVPLRDPDLSGGVDEGGPYLRVSFELPRGAFATTVLAEIMKNDVE